MRYFYGLLFLLSPILFACEQNEPGVPENGGRTLKGSAMDTLTLRFGETIQSNEEGTWITFSKLIEDSRCPSHLVCFWPGNAKIELTYFDGSASHSVVLNTMSSFGSETIINDLYFELVEVIPYPGPEELHESDYTVKILISAANQVPGFEKDVAVTVRDYTGLDGCGWLLELENGDKLEAFNLSKISGIYDGMQLVISYIKLDDMASICMAGQIVKIVEAHMEGCQGTDFLSLDDDPSQLEHDMVTINNAWMEGTDLKLSVSYSGGCETHFFRLRQMPYFCGTPPLPTPLFYLVHDSNEDNCEAYLTDTLCFNLESLKDMYPQGTEVEIYTPDDVNNKKTITFLP